MREIKIRRPRSNEKRILLNLVHKLNVQTAKQWGLKPPRRLKKFRKGYEFLIAEYKDKIIAVVNYKETPAKDYIFAKKYFYVDNLFVEQKYRRKGIATALIRELVKIGKRRGVQKICIGANVRNRPALTLYKKLGGKKVYHEFLIKVQ